MEDRREQDVLAALATLSRFLSDVVRCRQRVDACERLPLCASGQFCQPPLSDRYGTASVSSSENGVDNNISGSKSPILPDLIRNS